ncbi:telomerase protein component 1 isoform X2 [Syngnathus acus]|uniref:telomerase protein component 1 isoform X1 n=1 Tax=Syngnathus acus TaxID=161584 RepID=UPI0018860AD4|nr:telomerase protein component 1 isoform X1 [Syngnathus acus]XP_037131489.1 telomerase protein component 1 isoform X2 [Syngnathus acus]
MRGLDLQINMASSTSGRSLTSNYVPPSLENKLLTQTSSSLPSFSLQPSGLTSTSSSSLLFSASSSIASPLLSTQNTLLSSSRLTSFTPSTSNPLLATSLVDGALLSRFSQPPSFLLRDRDPKKVDEGGEEISEAQPFSFEETSVLYSDEDDEMPSEEEEQSEEEMVVSKAMEVCIPEHREKVEMVVKRREEFAQVVRDQQQIDEELKDKKYFLLNAVCCSLVQKSTNPGQKDWHSEQSVWTKITNLVKKISEFDPQFVLKVALYTRQELNIRITANFLLALAANLPATKCHVRRYFCASVQLPSDWLEVVRIYSACFSRSLPMCLKKAMADKFKEFSEYQLAKYNTRKHRCKHNRNKSKKPSDKDLTKWANWLRSDTTILQKYLNTDVKTTVDKKQNEFNMKKMIKKFHIKEPAEHVMAILGRKYPADQKAFNRSGLKGYWDRDRAGQRMKLKDAETWERLLSQEGNKAATWEKLIDNNSLPFMAMLRNLRNMIKQGISMTHHEKILRRLVNKKAVVQSRQFPFRFLSAYKVIMELCNLSMAQTSSNSEILKNILKKIPKSKRFGRLDWQSASRKRLRVALGVPFVYRVYRMKKDHFLKANLGKQRVSLLERYRQALEKAVQLSCRYNIPPLPGRTVILVHNTRSNRQGWCKKLDFCIPPKSNDEEEEEEDDERKKKKSNEDKLCPSALEVTVLLSLMLANSCEDARIFLLNYHICKEAQLESDVVLENVLSLTKQFKALEDMQVDAPLSIYFHQVLQKHKLDNIILLTEDYTNYELEWAIKTYRKETNNKCLYFELVMSDTASRFTTYDRNHIFLPGFSEQILRFVAERGSSRLLDHVEHLDKVYNVPPPTGAKDPEITNSLLSIPTTPKLRWRGVRVFISSTFRDMQAERDVLVRSVFPELRRRAAPYCLHLQEVELRWGVTEEESGRAAALCLAEVARSQMMVAILGQRYGVVPDALELPDLPQYKWLKSEPEGLSVTDMEIRHFQALYGDAAKQRMLCYFRNPDVIKTVPVAWRSHFAAESKDTESKMERLKQWIHIHKLKVNDNYPCEWGGVVEGKPYLKNLEVFAKAVLEDLWETVVKQFINEDEEDEADTSAEMLEQEVHQEALRRQFVSRAKLLSAAVEMVEQVQANGGAVVVEGAPGQGKTVFMAALAEALRSGAKSKKNLACDVISYSTAASQSSRGVEKLLRYLVRCLRRLKEEELPLPLSYEDLLSDFHATLKAMKRSKPLVLLVDGVDLVCDDWDQLRSDWIPQHLAQGVCLVTSVATTSQLLHALSKKKSTLLFTLPLLTVTERKEVVQKELEVFGKKLSDAAFNNQLQTLIMKKSAECPLYLHMACEDLRNFASFDKLNESLQALPQSVNLLVQYRLKRLCSEHRGLPGLCWALGALTVRTAGLREHDFYSLLCACNDLCSLKGQVTWQQVLALCRSPKGRIPMVTFTRIVHSLRSLVSPSQLHDADDVLALSNPDVRRAFEDVLLPSEDHRRRAHLVLAGHLWGLADAQGADTFLHGEVDAVQQLSASLIQSDELEVLRSLLSSYNFLYANVRSKLLHHLLDTYNEHDKKSPPLSVNQRAAVDDCRDFLQRHGATLSRWPALFVQQALNEPPETLARAWARGLMGSESVRVLEWLNNDHQTFEKSSQLVSTFTSEPTCLAVDCDGEMVVGTGQGTLHFINANTGQQVKSLVSSCDGISSCLFLKDGRIATTSFDGQIEIWDSANGCRTSLIKGHTNVITASDITTDRKHLATVSLDYTIKVWSLSEGDIAAVLPSDSPLNCATFDPEDRLLAAGCWNGKVVVWKWLQCNLRVLLCGHNCSVRSLSFSPSSPTTLCSGSVSGEVRVWSVDASTCVGCFQAHVGATDSLAFLDQGRLLLSAGSDHMLQLWSGGLGRSIGTLRRKGSEQEPPHKKSKCHASTEAAVLCAAVNGDHVALGYSDDGFKLFCLSSGEMIWESGLSHLSVPSLLWVRTDATDASPLLLSSGHDKRVRLWRRKLGADGELTGLEMTDMFGTQFGIIHTMAHNATYLATALDDCTIFLWLLSKLSDYNSEPPAGLLKGHSACVTSLAFSPDGEQLLSGGKDKALMVWDMTLTPPGLSKVLPAFHRDWITGCVWTPDCVISSSNDGRLCLWDLEAGQSLREITWTSPLTSVCCLGPYVVAGSTDGNLHVWEWETSVNICHISAHEGQIRACSIVPDAYNKKKSEDLTVLTAAQDGIIRLWKPLQVEHFSTFQGHSGAIRSVAHEGSVPQVLTVSEDRSLRSWMWETERAPGLRRAVTALCFSDTDGRVLLVGYDSGLLEVWRCGRAVGRMQASDGKVVAICAMPNCRFAVGYLGSCVDVWKLAWNQDESTASIVKVTSYQVMDQVAHLAYCSILIGVSKSGSIFDVTCSNDSKMRWSMMVQSWSHQVSVLGLIRNDEKSIWLVGESDAKVHVGFIFAMGPQNQINSSFSSMILETDTSNEENSDLMTSNEEKSDLITAVSIDKEFVVCGDVAGNMWFNTPPQVSTWSSKKPAHHDRISVLRLTHSLIISASLDHTVKLWERSTKKQVGMFVCGSPVVLLEVNPENPSEMVCGDTLGKVYFLSWRE